MVIQGREMCENEGKGDRKTAMEKCREDIFREKEGERVLASQLEA